MKIETNNNMSFGMALHMPKQKNMMLIFIYSPKIDLTEQGIKDLLLL